MRAAYLRAIAAVGALGALYVAIALPFVVLALVIGGLLRGAELFTSGEAVIVAEVVIALVALSLELVGPRRLPSGISVGPGDQPRLWDLVRETARDLDVPEPDGIVLTGGTAVGLRSVRRPGITLHRHLVFGCAVLDGLSERQLRAVTAVALGGLRRRRPPLPDRIALHGVDMVDGLADAARGRGGLGDAAERFAERYARVCAPVLSLQERVQDRFAAGTYGTEAVADGLDAMRRLRTAWGWYRRGYIDAGLACGCVPADPLGDFKALLADPERIAALAELPAGEPPHPLAVRAERLRARPLPAKVSPDGPLAASAPGLDDPRRVAAHLHPYLVVADTHGFASVSAFHVLDGMTALDREAFLRQVNGYRAAYRAARLAPAARRAGAEPPVTLGGVLALLVNGEGARLAREFDARPAAADASAPEAETARATDDTDRTDDASGTGPDSPVAAALAALLACAWVDAGRARWKTTWSGRDEVTAHDGTPLDLAGPAARALATRDGARDLRAAIADAGVSLYYEPRVPIFAAAKERETAAGHR
ncbi:MAG TPA: hypothetical protein VLH10_10820 [Yinghuangia sp.]|nr:hypothetical protein [Yinghuangia sp.]